MNEGRRSPFFRAGVLVSLAACALITGCGGSSADKTSSSTEATSSTPAAATGTGTQTLAGGTLPGGTFTILGRPFALHGTNQLGLTAHVQASEPGASVSFEEPRTTGVIEGPLALDIESGCAGRHPFWLAYGWLREPQDSVSAEAGGRTIAFKKVAIPASFQVRGAVVHTPLPGAVKIVVRAPGGHAVKTEQYGGGEARTCRG